MSRQEYTRSQWQRLFALANEHDLQDLYQHADWATPYELSQGPETGLVTVRGRVSGDGVAFNLGDASVTKTQVVLHDGTRGFAMTLGANATHSLLAALLDAAMQVPQAVRLAVPVRQLAATLAQRHAARQTQISSTKVDFFTLVRGD